MSDPAQTVDYTAIYGRAEGLIGDMQWLTRVYARQRFGLTNAQRLEILHAAADLVMAVAGPAWAEKTPA